MFALFNLLFFLSFVLIDGPEAEYTLSMANETSGKFRPAIHYIYIHIHIIWMLLVCFIKMMVSLEYLSTEHIAWNCYLKMLMM